MKRVDLIRAIESMGCEFVRHGGKHDWYQNPRTRVSQPVPRHREIKEYLAKSILARLADPEKDPPLDQNNSHDDDDGAE